jgi:hypothetical protein
MTPKEHDLPETSEELTTTELYPFSSGHPLGTDREADDTMPDVPVMEQLPGPLSSIRRKSKSTVDLDRLEQHFAARCRAVVRVPYDPHLEEGAEVELDYLNTETADAYLTLTALVADAFAYPRSSLSNAAPGFPLG